MPAHTRKSLQSFDHGRISLTNNAAERALRCIPLGRKAWLFCGTDRGSQRAAVFYTLIQTAKLNDVDPQAWLSDTRARIVEHQITQIEELLPWNWAPSLLKADADSHNVAACNTVLSPN